MNYEVKMSRMGLDENGKDKKFTETYLVSAMTVLEAVTLFEEYITPFYKEHTTLGVKLTKYSEVCLTEDGNYKFFSAKYCFVTIDETTGREKKTTNVILIQASDYDAAKEHFEKMSSGWLIDVELKTLGETAIIDYIV